jgi:hypothetical protein
MYINLQVKSPLFLFQILVKLEISRHVFENSSNINFIKIRQLAADLFSAD